MKTIRPGSEGRFRARSTWAVTALALALAACGGGGGGDGDNGPAARPQTGGDAPPPMAGRCEDVARHRESPSNLPDQPTSQRDAVRLADQASFGATEALIKRDPRQGRGQVDLGADGRAQVALHERQGPGGAPVDQASPGFCDSRGANCSRDWKSSTPLQWDFYRNAVEKPDQLRQRVALALQQIVVVSGLEVEGTYGLRNYHNMLLDEAFGNYRSLLKKVALSPVMGTYLDNANNNMTTPNENFSRELLQLFSVGTCELNMDGSLKGGACTPVYNNERVRDYADALTGWTYPPGGVNPYGTCWPRGANCLYYAGDMVPLAAHHDSQPRKLLVRRLAGGRAQPLPRRWRRCSTA